MPRTLKERDVVELDMVFADPFALRYRRGTRESGWGFDTSA